MAINKKEMFRTEDQALSRFAKALSHPARLTIMRELAKRNTCICGEIVEVLPLAQSTVSQHLKELTQAGLIKGSVEGPKSCYCINWESLLRFKDDLNSLFGDIQKSNHIKCC